MSKWLISSFESIPAIFLCALGIYLAVIIHTRIAGKRSFSKMSSFDFAMTVAIGSIIATTVVSKSVTLMQGVVGLTAIYIFQFLTAYFRNFKSFKKVVDNNPLLIMKDGKVLRENLNKSMISEGDLRAKLREANVIQLSEVKAVVFETTGDVSVLHGKDDTKIDEWIMEGVNH